MGADLLEIADELYALALPDFTPARDAKAKELKGTDLAKEVKALKKPSLAAWVVNLLVRHEAEQVEQVLQVGAALREAQESMSGDELRQLTRQRRQLTAAVTTQARRLAREHGQKVTEAVADQVEATLTAAMVDEECGKAVRSGMLLSRPRVDRRRRGRAGPGRRPARRARLRRHDPRGRRASQARPARRPRPRPGREGPGRRSRGTGRGRGGAGRGDPAYDEAAKELADLEARSMQVQAEIDELKRKIAELEEAGDEVDDEIGEAEEVRDEAQDAVTEATRARDAAAKAVAKLEG